MKRTILVLTLLLVACAPTISPSGGPALPTAYIDPSYPTMQAQPAVMSQLSSGIEVSADRAWRDGKQVNVDICFTLLNDSDWSIWNASLQYPGASIPDFQSTMLSIQAPVEGQNGKRCDTLSFFNVPPDADLSSVTVTVDAIAALPRNEEYCSIYMPKIQQTLNERGIAITLDCPEINGEPTMQIVSKPDTMTQEEAEQLIYSPEYYTVQGPWEFTFNLGQ
jgi:hypothetical protein